MKICSICQILKPEEEFARYGTGRIMQTCLVCKQAITGQPASTIRSLVAMSVQEAVTTCHCGRKGCVRTHSN
jgi:hypothetical protein